MPIPRSTRCRRQLDAGRPWMVLLQSVRCRKKFCCHWLACSEIGPYRFFISSADEWQLLWILSFNESCHCKGVAFTQDTVAGMDHLRISMSLVTVGTLRQSRSFLKTTIGGIPCQVYCLGQVSRVDAKSNRSPLHLMLHPCLQILLERFWRPPLDRGLEWVGILTLDPKNDTKRHGGNNRHIPPHSSQTLEQALRQDWKRWMLLWHVGAYHNSW